MYRPVSNFATPLMLLVPKYENIEGINYKEYPDEGPIFFGSFKSYGGTNLKGSQDLSADILTIIDTANIECYFRKDISADCRIKNLVNGGIYDIINEPENIEQRSVLLKFKVQRWKAGV